MNNDLFRIINTPWILLDSDELKIYSIVLFVLSFLGGIIGAIVLHLIFSMNIYYAIFIFLVISILMAIFTYKRDWFDKKYGLSSEYHIGMNYSVIFYLLLIINVAISLLFFYSNFKNYGLQFAGLMFFSEYIPLVYMLLRINVFDDKNCRIIKKDAFGNVYYVNGLGYNPLIYFFISIPFSMIIGFYLNSYVGDILGSSYITFNLIYLVLSIAILFLLLSPDVLNRILPFELKTWSGTGKFIILLFVIVLVFRYLIK